MAITNPKFVFEVIEEASKAKTKKEKIELLQKHQSAALKDILRGTYDDTLQFNLPPGEPPFTANDPHNAPSNLMKQHKQFGYFIKGGSGEKLHVLKKEMMFIRLLEAIHPADAKLVCNMTNKVKINGLTKAVVKEAFPNLIKE